MNYLNSLVLEDLICRHLHMYLHTLKPRLTEITSSIMRFYLPITAKREKYLDKYSYFNILFPCCQLIFSYKSFGITLEDYFSIQRYTTYRKLHTRQQQDLILLSQNILAFINQSV